MILKKIEGKDVEIKANQVKGNAIQTFTTTNINVTTSTTETTILEQTLSQSGTYLLTGSIYLNNYGTQVGREHRIRIYANNDKIFEKVRVINSEVYTISEAVAVPFEILAGQKIKITIQSAINKSWACDVSSVKVLKLFS